MSKHADTHVSPRNKLLDRCMRVYACMHPVGGKLGSAWACIHKAAATTEWRARVCTVCAGALLMASLVCTLWRRSLGYKEDGLLQDYYKPGRHAYKMLADLEELGYR